MKKVIPINADGLTPQLMLEEIAKDMGEFKEFFAIAITNDGKVNQYLCGEAKSCCFAGAILQETALALSNIE